MWVIENQKDGNIYSHEVNQFRKYLKLISKKAWKLKRPVVLSDIKKKKLPLSKDRREFLIRYVNKRYKEEGFSRQISFAKTSLTYPHEAIMSVGKKRRSLQLKGYKYASFQIRTKVTISKKVKSRNLSLVHKEGLWCLQSLKRTHDSNKHFENIVGIDLGTNFLAVANDSKDNSYFIGDSFFTKKKSISDLTQTDYEKIFRKSKVIAERLVHMFPKKTLFVFEDIRKPKTNEWNISKVFHHFIHEVEGEAKKKGSALRLVSPYRTSTTCPKCGFYHENNRIKERHVFVCKKCGYQGNDDLIAAENIKKRGML